MKSEINYSEFIQRYLEGIMSPEEKHWFEKELDSNPELQDELVLYQHIDSAISDKEVFDMEDQLDQIYAELNSEKPKETPSKNRVKPGALKIAGIAVALTMIISLAIYEIAPRQLSNAAIYNKYYQPYESNMNFRSGDETVNVELRTAMEKYEQKDYAKAIVMFENILQKDASRVGLNLYTGISHMEINEYRQAGKSFKKVIEHQQNLYIDQAEWYLGFCYLKTGKREKAKEQFTKIANSQSFYKDKAKQIVSRM